MYNASQFNKGLKTVSTNVTQMRGILQQLALYCIYQNCNANTNPCTELLKTLTVPNKAGDGFEYTTADAERVMKYISDFSPVNIRPQKCEVKFSRTRADKGMVWRAEEDYPLWHEYSKTREPRDIKEQDGFAVLHATVKRLLDRVKDGQLHLTAESRPAFETILTKIDEIVANEQAAIAKKVSADKDQEQNQKPAGRGKVRQPEVALM